VSAVGRGWFYSNKLEVRLLTVGCAINCQCNVVDVLFSFIFADARAGCRGGIPQTPGDKEVVANASMSLWNHLRLDFGRGSAVGKGVTAAMTGVLTACHSSGVHPMSSIASQPRLASAPVVLFGCRGAVTG
jgi:hypothetical protein